MLKKVLIRYRERGGRALARAIARKILPARLQDFVREPTPLDPVLKSLARSARIRILQVGAYIGDSSNDPLIGFIRKTFRGHPDARAILVEPILKYFELLQENYVGTPGLAFENVAIAESEGDRDFHYLSIDPVEHGFPEWLSQLGSLREDRMKSVWERYERHKDIQDFYLRHRTTTKVRCTQIASLLKKHDFSSLDLLQIDAEGYDFEILKTLDFSVIRPRYINYERVLLDDHEQQLCRATLERAGYSLQDWGQDTLCSLTH